MQKRTTPFTRGSILGSALRRCQADKPEDCLNGLDMVMKANFSRGAAEAKAWWEPKHSARLFAATAIPYSPRVQGPTNRDLQRLWIERPYPTM